MVAGTLIVLLLRIVEKREQLNQPAVQHIN